MRSLLETTPEQLAAWLAERGLPGYRAGQIRRWLFDRAVDDFDSMTDLSKDVRTHLAEDFQLRTTRVIQRQKADDGAEKLLLELADGERIECVLLRDDKQNRTACVSTQVGCSMGCVFCASGLDGLVRNLTSGEILEQLLHIKRLLADDERLGHIVVMGVGEPLANLSALLPALAIATAQPPDGMGVGVRRVTISTVGLPSGIRRLTEENIQYHLAVSLHAADDALRNQLVPANRNVGIDALLSATDEYFNATGRRVTFEYVLLGGVNDQPSHARRLVALLKGRPALVNLIPYNPVAGLPYHTPTRAVTDEFVETLRRGGLTVRVRYRKGDRINAACGQLRRC